MCLKVVLEIHHCILFVRSTEIKSLISARLSVRAGLNKMKSTAYSQSEEWNGNWAWHHSWTNPPESTDTRWRLKHSSYLRVRVETEEDNEGRTKRLNEGTLLGPTWCVPWIGVQGQLSSGHWSIYSLPILDYSSTWYVIWKRIRLTWKVPHQLMPSFLFLSVSLLRAI